MIKPIYLYGFMGCGKSYIAKKSGLDFIDLDEYIVRLKGIEIAEIFVKYSEQYFRELELAALKELNVPLVSLGGGALKTPETAKYAKENAVVIFIDTPFEVCCKRIKIDGLHRRPLAENKTKEGLFELYNSRLPHYRNVADYIVKGEEESLKLIMAETGKTILP
ncbi:MAG: shikimate kinase [Oscillospiraceae bacterium]|nr:shikimate kinase [Oscillospiraceae bacterium]